MNSNLVCKLGFIRLLPASLASSTASCCLAWLHTLQEACAEGQSNERAGTATKFKAAE
jgi:hypothetical protein